jgi:hypothetical protein
MEAVESTSEQSEWDVMRPEVVTRHMVEQWMHAGLTLDNWAMLGDVIQQQTLAHLTEVYKSVNALLADMGVLPDLEGGGGRVRRWRRRSPHHWPVAMWAVRVAARQARQADTLADMQADM